jgi:5-methyltetrahydropteroyltriglutamate--homocysteine methyltransferase
LRKAIADFDAGKITLDDLHRVEDEVTVEVIREQIDAGLGLITDGKIRWEDEQTYLARKLAGFAIDGLIRYFDSNTYYRQPTCVGAVSWTEPITVRDYSFAVEHSTRPVKAVLTGPYTLARLSENHFYKSLDEFVFALADALNREVLALQAAGATFIQLDEPAILRHKADWPLLEAAVRRVTRNVTAKLALYTYFGDVDGVFPDILSLPVAVVGLDFVQGVKNWDVVTRAPFTRELGLGIVDARNTRLERVGELHQALDRISAVVSLDRVYVNPTCGLEFLPRERAQEKLANMVRAVQSYERRAGRS